MEPPGLKVPAVTSTHLTKGELAILERHDRFHENNGRLLESIASRTKVIPSMYANAKGPPESIKWQQSWFISGDPGVGKTWAAYAIYRKIISAVARNAHKHVLWPMALPMPPVVAPVLMSKLRTMVSAHDDRLSERIDDLIGTKYLIIDDLGGELRSDFSDNIIFQIVEERYANEFYTGFTSNFERKDLPYDDRIKSRIFGIVGDNVAIIKGTDRRVK